MRGRAYLSVSVALLVVTAACGASTSDKTKLRKDLIARAPNSSTVRCKDTTRRLGGRRVFRCTIELETGVHGMTPQPSCYLWQDGRALDVTRRLGHC